MLSQGCSIKILRKKKTYLAALQTQWDTLGHTMTPKTVEKQLQ